MNDDLTTHDDNVVAEARAFVCTSYETLRRHSERMTSGGLTADDKADRQHIMLKALNLLSHLADECDALREAGYTSHSDVCPRCGTQIEQAAWYDESRDGDGHDGWLGQSRCPSCHWAGERYDLPDSPDEAKPAPEPLAEETEDVFAWSPGDGLWARK